MSEHTKEPWRVKLTDNAVYYIFHYTGNGDEEEVIEYFAHDKPGQDARRTVARVIPNCCAAPSTPISATILASVDARSGVYPIVTPLKAWLFHALS